MVMVFGSPRATTARAGTAGSTEGVSPATANSSRCSTRPARSFSSSRTGRACAQRRRKQPGGCQCGGRLWRPRQLAPSSEFGGSPGAGGKGPRPSEIVINEVLASAVPPALDQIELLNTGGQDVAVTGWYISDTSENYFKSRITLPAVVPARGYYALSEADMGFGLNGTRDGQLWLISADSQGRPLHFVDHVQFPASSQGTSLGPWPLGPEPRRDRPLLPLSQHTFGGPNAVPAAGEIVISEIYYHPVDPDGPGGLGVKDFEFVELHNTTGQPIPLAGWRLTGDVTLDFPEGMVLGAGQTAVVVGFDPSDVNKSSVFRFTLGMSAEVPLLGQLSDSRGRRGSSGVMADEGALVQLVRTGEPSQDDPGVIPVLVVDQIAYGPVSPWPEGPAGHGQSLTRVRPQDHGLDANSWVGAAPTPGHVQFFQRLAGDVNDDGQFDQADVAQLLQSAKYLQDDSAGWWEGDWDGDGLFNPRDIVLALQTGSFGTRFPGD